MEYDTIKLLNLEDADIDLSKSSVVKNDDNTLNCIIVLNKKQECCSVCGSLNYKINDYVCKRITHSISTHNPCSLIYKARRYKCKDCNNTFYEKNPFCQKDEKVSLFTELKVLEKLRSHTSTFSSVARDLNLSVQGVINIFDKYVNASRLTLPTIICMDEIYTNRLTKKKYSCVLYDFLGQQLIDVYPSRLKIDLINNLSKIPLKERSQVKYVVIDMWDTYNYVSKLVFPNCRVAVDSFHVITHLNLAIDCIRLKVMRKFNHGHSKLENADMYYYMLKKFHYFFNKSFDNIYDGDIKIPKIKSKWDKYEIRKYLLSIDDILRDAYNLKEKFQEFNATAHYENCDVELNYFIEKFSCFPEEEFREFGRLLNHWKNEIKNSFIRINNYRLSNGRMEGCNSRLKCIIKNANGYRNFNRFRNKCFFSINKNTPIINPKKLK